MGYQRAMYLLSLLYSNTDEHKGEIQSLFKQAIAKTEEYQKLSRYLQTLSFFSFDGEGIYNESKDAIEQAVKDIQNPEKNLQQMKLLIGLIDRELTKTKNLIESTGFFDDGIAIMPSELISEYTEFYKCLANAICYMLIAYFGARSIENLNYNHSAGFQELVRLINHHYSSELLHSSGYKTPFTWAIYREYYGGDNLIEYPGYRIDYRARNSSDFPFEDQQGRYNKLAPFLYVSNSSEDEVRYWGIGNMVGVDINNSISLLGSTIITELDAQSFRNLSSLQNDPLRNIAKALKTDIFCISPENYVSALNRWSMEKTVEERKRNHTCIFCGQQEVDDSLVCDSHFSVNR